MIDCQIVILAAGNGRRMATDLPKVMQQVGGKPMIERVLINATSITKDVILVYSQHLRPYLDDYAKSCKLVLQENPLGTAHAVYSAIDLLKPDLPIAVVYADNPLISSDIICNLFDNLVATSSSISTLAFQRSDPSQYGRIITDHNGKFIKIVEYKDASNEERQVALCNSGVMAFSAGILHKYLPYCVRSSEASVYEFYLTKMIEVCQPHEKLSYLLSPDDELVIGVNTKQELLYANQIFDKLNNS